MADRVVSVRLSADVDDFRRGMSQAEQDVSKLDTTTKKTGQGISTFAKGAAGALAGIGLVSFASDAIKASSDLQQSMGKASDIFGTNAQAITDWSKTSATAFGLSQQAALEAASTFGDMFTQLGFAGPKAADLSKQVVQLAGDLGAFNNLPTADVLDRIGGAFRGEYDALQKVIPNISAARVQTEAMAETGKKNADSLTAQEKATAVLAIVQKDGAKAQGNFAATADQAATQQQTLAAEMENTKAAIGDSLLPAFQSLMGVAQDLLPVVEGIGTAIGGVVTFLGEIPEPVWAAVAAFTAFKLVAGSDWLAKTKAGLQGFSTAVAQVRIDADESGKYVSKLGATAEVAKGKFSGLSSTLKSGLGFAAIGVGIDTFVQALQEAGSVEREQQQHIQALVDSYGDLGPAIDEATRAIAYQNISSVNNGTILKWAHENGVAAKDLVDAYLGLPSGDAVKEKLSAWADGPSTAESIFSPAVAAAAGNLHEKVVDLFGEFDASKSTWREQQDAIKGTGDAMDATGEASREAAANARGYSAAKEAEAAAMANASSEQERYVEFLTGRGNTASHDAAVATAERTAANLEFQRVMEGNAAANESDAAAVDKAQAAYDKAKAALTPYAQQLQDAADANSDLAQETSEVITQVDKLAGRVPTAEQAISDMHAATDALAKSAGVGSKDFEAYSTAIVKSSGEIDTASETGRQYRDDTIKVRDAIVAAGEAEYKRVASTKGAKAGMEAANKVVQQGVKDWKDNSAAAFGGGEAGKAAAEKVAKGYNLIPKVIETAIKTDAKQSDEAAAKTKKKLDDLNGAKANVLITGDNSDAQGKADATDRKWADLQGKTSTLHLNATADTSSAEGSLSYLFNSWNGKAIHYSVGVTQAHAGGGAIVGGSGTKDDVPIMGMGGEHMLTKSDVAAMGGQSGVYSFRRQLHGGVLAMASGGAVPSAASIAGVGPRSLGAREGISVDALGELAQFVKDLAANAKDASVALSDANHELRVAQNTRRSELAEVKKSNAARLAAITADASALQRKTASELKSAKTAKDREAILKREADGLEKLNAKQSKAEKQNAAALAKVTAEQNKKVAAAKREADSTAKSARAANLKADAEAKAYRATDKARNIQVRLTQQLDRATDKLAADTDRLNSIKADKAQLAGSVASGIKGIGGGVAGFSEQRTTVASILNGAAYNAKNAGNFKNDLARLAKLGLNAQTLQELSDPNNASTAHTLVGGTAADIKKLNSLVGQTNAYANQAGGIVAGATYDKSLTAAQNQVAADSKARTALDLAAKSLAKGMAKEFGDALDGRIAKVTTQGLAVLVRKGESELKRRGA